MILLHWDEFRLLLVSFWGCFCALYAFPCWWLKSSVLHSVEDAHKVIQNPVKNNLGTVNVDKPMGWTAVQQPIIGMIAGAHNITASERIV